MQMKLEPVRKQFIIKILPPWTMELKTRFSQNVIFWNAGQNISRMKNDNDLKFSGNVYLYKYYKMSGADFLFYHLQASAGSPKSNFLGHFGGANSVSVYEKYKHDNKISFRSFCTTILIDVCAKYHG